MGAICVLVYKYGMSLDRVLDLTLPQIEILRDQLEKICKAEAGEKDTDYVNPDIRENYNRIYGDLIKTLQEKTGKKAFTLKELNNPAETIKKYKKV